MISVDFRLQLKFPARPVTSDAAQPVVHTPDFTVRPAFLLMMHGGSQDGKESSQYFDVLDVSDEEWDQWKASGEQFDDRIVEVIWNKAAEKWVCVRFRDDKLDGNHASIVKEILQSIQHGVEAGMVSLWLSS